MITTLITHKIEYLLLTTHGYKHFSVKSKYYVYSLSELQLAQQC